MLAFLAALATAIFGILLWVWWHRHGRHRLARAREVFPDRLLHSPGVLDGPEVALTLSREGRHEVVASELAVPFEVLHDEPPLFKQLQPPEDVRGLGMPLLGQE